MMGFIIFRSEYQNLKVRKRQSLKRSLLITAPGKARVKTVKYLNHFHLTGRVAGGFKTKNGSVITIVTRSGKDAFVRVSTNEKDVPANGTRIAVEGYVSRRRGHEKNGDTYYAQCFVAESVMPDKTAAEKEYGSGTRGMYYDEPSFTYNVAGEVLRVINENGFSKALVQTRRPNGKGVNVWLSMKTPSGGFPAKQGDNALFVTGVYTEDRRHETLTIRDIVLFKDDTKEKDNAEKKTEAAAQEPAAERKAGRQEKSIVL